MGLQREIELDRDAVPTTDAVTDAEATTMPAAWGASPTNAFVMASNNACICADSRLQGMGG
jgi:hypothetical protein